MDSLNNKSHFKVLARLFLLNKNEMCHEDIKGLINDSTWTNILRKKLKKH